MENVFAKLDIIWLDITVVYALLYKFMILLIEFVDLDAKVMKFGILQLEPADVYLDST